MSYHIYELLFITIFLRLLSREPITTLAHMIYLIFILLRRNNISTNIFVMCEHFVLNHVISLNILKVLYN